MTKKEELTERRMQAFQLRKDGHQPPEIAELMGVALSSVYSYINEGRAAYFDMHPEEKQHVRNLELARLDDMTLATFNQAKAGDLKAVETMLKIMERRSKFLGLDAPSRQEIETKTLTATAAELTDDELASIIRNSQH